MKRYLQVTIFAGLLALVSTSGIKAQESEAVYPIFETLTLVDNQTVYVPYKGSLNLEIQHRFSQIKDIKDIFGIYGSANTRLGLSYSITDKIMVGFGTTRSFVQQDLEWKYNFLQQMTEGMPVSLAYYGNAVLDARNDKYFGLEADYKFLFRMSTLHQIIASRKFGEKIGVQLAPTFVYYEAVPEGYRNANLNLDMGAKFQVLGFHSIILEFDQPLLQPKEGEVSLVDGELIEPNTIYPNISLGVEIGTSTHSFRVFVSNYNAIVKNRSVAFNSRNPLDGDFQFGFNISIRF